MWNAEFRSFALAVSSLHESETFYNDHDKVLNVRHDGGGRKASAVQQLVYNEFVRIHCVEEDRAHRTVLQDTVGRRHISGRDSVQHGRKFPVAIVCSMVARQMTVVAFFTMPRIAVCPS